MQRRSRSKAYSQVRIKSSDHVRGLVERSGINSGDTVVEVGGGTGVITRELCSKAGFVIAIEKDKTLTKRLTETMSNVENLVVFAGDALLMPLPSSPYKLFANIPFAIEGRLVRRLLDLHGGLVEAFVIVRGEYAIRWAGVNKVTMFYAKYYPWFELEIVHEFKQSDFHPKPKVKASMLHIKRREVPYLGIELGQKYAAFVDRNYPSRPLSSAKDWVNAFKEGKGARRHP